MVCVVPDVYARASACCCGCVNVRACVGLHMCVCKHACAFAGSHTCGVRARIYAGMIIILYHVRMCTHIFVCMNAGA